MSRYWAWSAAILACALSAGIASAANNDAGRAAFQRFSGGPATSPFPAPPEKSKPKPEPEAPKASDLAAALRAQEEATFLRRIHVFDRIKDIALKTGDAQLESQAIRIEERAREVYKLRTANLPTSKPAAKVSGGDKP